MKHDIIELPKPRRGTTQWAINLSPSEQFLRDVMCTAVDQSCDYWASFRVVDTVENDGYKEPTCVIVKEIDEDGEIDENDPGVRVDLTVLSEGIARVLAGGMMDKDITSHKPGDGDPHSSYRAKIYTAVIEDDAGQIDIELADLIMQAAALRCIRYG